MILCYCIKMIRLGIHDGPPTWGSSSNPEIAAHQLKLDEHLAALPTEGIVFDIGAGIALSLAAAIHVRRSDLKIISVDPGFGFMSESELQRGLDLTIGHFSPEQQLVLRGSQTWHRDRVATIAEDLTLDSNTADLVVSYAAIPEYTIDSAEAALEILRVLKIGGVAVNGPTREESFWYWDQILNELLAGGQIKEYQNRVEALEGANGDSLEAYFTSFTTTPKAVC
jgi:SAM-dependent methyltransferase